MKPYYQKSGITIYNADCREVAKFVKCDFILTDPPYPNWHTDKWEVTPIDFLNDFSCRQFVFWSAMVDFPLDFTATHIWDKKTGAGRSEYERIFERNGEKAFKVFRHYLINSTVAANYGSDIFTGHETQKPIKLMRELITKFVPAGAVIFDPFSGSGSTLAAARDLGYQAVGCEVSEKWCSVSVERLAQQSLFTLPNNRLHLDVGDSPAQQALFTPEADTAEGKSPTPAPRR